MSVAYPVKLEELPEGQGFIAHWVKEPRCVAQGMTREETLQNIKAEIRFWIETCPCGTVSDDHVEVEIVPR